MGTSILFFLAGMILMGILFWVLMPKMMITNHKSRSDFETTKKRLMDEIHSTGEWKVMEEFDFQKNIQASGFEKADKASSLALCNPKYAAQILSEIPNCKVTSIMPLTIGIFEDENHNVQVSELNVRLMGMMFGGTIAKVMQVAGKDVHGIIQSAIGR